MLTFRYIASNLQILMTRHHQVTLFMSSMIINLPMLKSGNTSENNVDSLFLSLWSVSQFCNLQLFYRGSADAAQLLANDFENCGSGYTYTVPKENGHTLTTAKKSCSYGYHSSLHEVGHNFGCHHDRDNGDNSYYDYGYGWLIGPEDLDGIGYRTVLAYSNPGYHRYCSLFIVHTLQIIC